MKIEYLEAILIDCQFMFCLLIFEFLDNCLNDIIRAVEGPQNLSPEESAVDCLVFVIGGVGGSHLKSFKNINLNPYKNIQLSIAFSPQTNKIINQLN